jgi:hypothetical protein
MFNESHRFLQVDSFDEIASQKATLRRFNETMYHFVNTGDYSAALDEIRMVRSMHPSLMFNIDVITWYMSISEKVPFSVQCRTEDGEERLVRFVSIESLDTILRPPSASSDVEIMSQISVSMRLAVDGPVFPVATASNLNYFACSAIPSSPVCEQYPVCSHPACHHPSDQYHLNCEPAEYHSSTAVLLFNHSSRQLIQSIKHSDIGWSVDGSSNDPSQLHEWQAQHPVVTCLKLSANGYLLIARSSSSLHTLSIWCIANQRCVGGLIQSGGRVIEARWSNSDTLLTVYFEEDQYLSYMLDWPCVTVESNNCSGDRELPMSSVPLMLSDLHLKATDSHQHCRHRPCYSRSWDDASVVIPTSTLFMHLAARVILHTPILPPAACELLHRKEWVCQDIAAWVNTGAAMSRPRGVYSSDPSPMIANMEMRNKVCVIHGPPHSGKSSCIHRAATESCSSQTIARIQLNRTILTSSSSHQIAFAIICTLFDNFRVAFGTVYTDAVLKCLAGEIRRAYLGKKRSDGFTEPSRPSRHHRHFSTASSSITLGSDGDCNWSADSLLLCTSYAIMLRAEEGIRSQLPLLLKVPDLRVLSVKVLFELIVEKPLAELPAPSTQVIFLDGLDLCDSALTCTHVQCITNLLIHRTPRWCKIVMTSRSKPALLPYFSDAPGAWYGIQIDGDVGHSEDLFAICEGILDRCSFSAHRSEEERGVVKRLLYSQSDGSLRNLILIETSLQQHLDIKSCLATLDPFQHSFEVDFLSSNSEVSL